MIKFKFTAPQSYTFRAARLGDNTQSRFPDYAY